MSKVYVLGDLHFSLGVDKPMDIFGKAWENHTERICENWRRIVSPDDCVVVNGDISWGLGLEEAVPDLILLDSLPGTKIIMKGNHELWWTTLAKLTNVLKEHDLKTIRPLYNNACFLPENELLICGTRGWLAPGDEEFKAQDEKIWKRELMRFGLSLSCGRSLAEKAGRSQGEYETVVFTHYPPFVFTKREPTEFTEMIERSGASRCYFGHVHGMTMKHKGQEGIPPIYRSNGVQYYLTAADYLNMEPALVCGDPD